MPYNPKAAARGRGSKAKGRRNGKDRTVYADSKDHGRPTSTIRDDDEVGSQDGSENDNEEDDDDDELVAPSCMRTSLAREVSQRLTFCLAMTMSRKASTSKTPMKRLPVAMWARLLLH
jgi:hypothetical protein